MGTTFKDMFEAFCEEYGKKSDVASEVRAPPLNDDRFDHPASQPRVGECAHVEGTTSHAPSTANNVPDSLDHQARGSTTEGTTSQPLSHGMDTVYTYMCFCVFISYVSCSTKPNN
nr:uncharacterized protein LOC131799103 [Pocillopora verrucosa]